MNIMVFDVPAEHGGALSILNEFYAEVAHHDDKDINWIFVLGKPSLESQPNIEVLNFPWIKKSWWHRLYFDYVIAPKLVKKYEVDRIFSLQNVTVPFVGVDQTLYVHQSLPFAEHRFNLRESRISWIYQNIIGKLILRSIRKAKKVVVQTQWLKEVCATKGNISREKIEIVPPKIELEIKSKFVPTKNALTTFFYPAGATMYKNHEVIVEACRILVRKGAGDFLVIFTLTGDENKNTAELLSIVRQEGLPVEFTGTMSREDVFDFYSKSVLLFPSYIETFGLPMLEARLHETVVVASDCSFSHEILDGYENAYFFNPFDAEQLAYYMMGFLSGRIEYIKVDSDAMVETAENLRLVDIIL